MLQTSTIQFLRDLAANNNREWFAQNRTQYEAAKTDFLAFATQLISQIALFDPFIAQQQAKDSIFRINRDTRFSKDKSPYKNNMGLWLTHKGKNSNQAGYYLHLEPTGDSFVAGGLYNPAKEELKKVRQEIDYHTAEFKTMIQQPDFVQQFGGLSGNKLKKAPKDYSPEHPNIELLKYTDFLAYRSLPIELYTTSALMPQIVAAYKAMKALNDFLNKAIE